MITWTHQDACLEQRHLQLVNVYAFIPGDAVIAPQAVLPWASQFGPP